MFYRSVKLRSWLFGNACYHGDESRSSVPLNYAVFQKNYHGHHKSCSFDIRFSNIQKIKVKCERIKFNNQKALL